MIHLFWGFIVSILLRIKLYFFFNLFLFLNSYLLILVSISFFLVVYVGYFLFSYFNSLDFNIYLIFYFSVLLINFCFVSDNIFSFLIFFELSLIPIVFLILNFGKDFDKLESSYFMLIMNLIGSLPFVLGVWFISNSFSTFSLVYMTFNIFYLDNFFIFIFINLIFLFKLPLFFFHFWLTKAHVRASGTCSMILARLMLKLGVMGVLKFVFFFIFFDCILFIFFPFILISSIWVLVLMIRSFNIKFLVALSSILHMSIIPILFYSFNFYGFTRRLLMIVGHGLVSGLLFSIVTFNYEQVFNLSLDFSKSLESCSKLFSWIFIFFVFLNFGVPPIINFLRELYCCLSMLSVRLFFFFFFFLSLIFSNSVLMFFCTKFLYGKKLIFSYFGGRRFYISFFCFYRFFLLFFLPFFL